MPLQHQRFCGLGAPWHQVDRRISKTNRRGQQAIAIHYYYWFEALSVHFFQEINVMTYTNNVYPYFLGGNHNSLPRRLPIPGHLLFVPRSAAAPSLPPCLCVSHQYWYRIISNFNMKMVAAVLWVVGCGCLPGDAIMSNKTHVLSNI